MQRLSIIVPLTGDLKRLEDTLVSVLENQPEQSEVVVVLNEPYDDPYQLRGEVKFVEARQGADLVDCFACGLAASDAPIVHTIASGFEATPGWADAALTRFAETDVAAVAPLVVDRDHPQRVLSAGVCWTAAGSVGRIASGKPLDQFAGDDGVLCGPELVVAFYRRDVLEMIERLPSQGSDLAAATESGFGDAQGRVSRRSGTGVRDDGHGRLVGFRQPLAGRRSRRAAFPALEGGSRLEAFMGRACRAGRAGVHAVSTAAVGPCPFRRPLLGRARFRRAANGGDRLSGSREPKGGRDSSGPFRHRRRMSGALIAGRRVTKALVAMWRTGGVASRLSGVCKATSGAGNSHGLKKRGASGISYKPNAAVDGAMEFTLR